MSLAIAILEREGSLTLTANHSQLEFFTHTVGFRLFRRNQLVLQSGGTWGEPCSRLVLWQSEGDAAIILTYQRAAHGFGRLRIEAQEGGWEFLWDQPTRDSFELASGKHWYGQGELTHQLFPLERLSLWETPLITWDKGPTGLGSIQTPTWLTATGVAILVDMPNDSLEVGINAPPPSILPNQWASSNYQSSANMRPPAVFSGSNGVLSIYNAEVPLKYYLLIGNDAPSAHRRLIIRLGKPDRIPPQDMLRQPIWTTWARFKTDIDQMRVIHFAREIREQGYPGATIEIDDKWQAAYGDTTFDPERFPDPTQMVSELAALGFATSVWIPPFFSPNSANAAEAIANDFLVKTHEGKPYPVRLWQSDGFLLDVSNPSARAWWQTKLVALKRMTGIAGFKFDAGEANYVPADAVTYGNFGRNAYSHQWVNFAANHLPHCEVRTGWFNQRAPVLFRQSDRYSTWGFDNGLASVITTTLMLSMTGYPFILPDIIGGNAYNGVMPDRELLIRWTQLSAPMLAIQFSIAPWDYDEETNTICRKYAELHVELADLRLAAAQEAVRSGAPVIRPIFWVAPLDEVAQIVEDEYMVGDALLVAPNIIQGARMRDIYLPSGVWRDYWSHEVLQGDTWLHQYPAALDILPMFIRVP